MEKFELKIRQERPLEVFRAIRFQTQLKTKITGHIRYIRTKENGYDHNAGDILDKKITEAITPKFDIVTQYKPALLLFEHQKENCLHCTKGSIEKEVKFLITPEIDFNTIETMQNTKLTAFELTLKMTVIILDDKKEADLLNDYFEIALPNDNNLKDLIKTIKRI